jgi:hypothetical protein
MQLSSKRNDATKSLEQQVSVSTTAVSLSGNKNLPDAYGSEIDPVFTAWDKHTGITIHQSQIISDAADIVPMGLNNVSKGITIGTSSAYVVMGWTAIVSSTFDHYHIKYKRDTFSNYSYLDVLTDNVSIEGLVPNTLYNFYICSVNKTGVASAFSSVVNVTTSIDTTLPATVTGLTATATTGAIVLSWTANTDADIASYNIYRKTTDVSSTSTLIANIAGNYFVDDGLPDAQIQYYWVKGKDTSNNLSAAYSDHAHTTPITAFSQTELETILGVNLANVATINPQTGFINPNTVGTLQLDSNSILSAISAAGKVEAAALDVAAINPTTGEINPNKIGTTQLVDYAIDEYKIADTAIKENKLATNAVSGPKIQSSAITAGKIDAGAVTADKILAGAVTASKMTSYNFVVDGPSNTFTTGPGAGEIQWGACKVYYEGIEYSISSGYCLSTDKHIYWIYEGITFSTSATLPVLSSDDFLVAFNNAGAPIIVWNSTVINGNRITTGSITATNMAANTITANEIAFGSITGDKIAANSITADRIVSYNFILLGGITTLTGSIDTTASTNVTGVGTLFTTELVIGDLIVVSGSTRRVVNIISNTSLVVDTAFSDLANDTSPGKLDLSLSAPLPFINTAGDHISWNRCLVRYKGLTYVVAAGLCSYADVYIYWSLSSPYELTHVTTLNSDPNTYLVATNGNYTLGKGITILTWNSTTIDGNRITSGTIVGTQIIAGSITTNEIGAGQITSDKILAGEIKAVNIDTNAITADKILSGAITVDKLDAGVINALLIEVGVTNKTFYNTRANAPTKIDDGLNVGDIWYITDEAYHAERCSNVGPPAQWQTVKDQGVVDMQDYIDQLNNILSDDVLSMNEKPTVEADYDNIVLKQGLLHIAADGCTPPITTKLTTLNTKVTALFNYLDALNPHYHDYSQDTILAVGGGLVLKNLFKETYTAISDLELEISIVSGDTLETKIGQGWITSGWISVSNTSGENCGITGASSASDAVRIWAGATRANAEASAPFVVRDDGSMRASDAQITGEINATSGLIGEWHIDSDSIHRGTKQTTDGVTAGTGDITIRATTGGASIHANNFYINADGSTSLTGKINGLLSKTIDIGVWGMHTHSVEQKDFPHNIADYTKIRAITVFIMRDDGSRFQQLIGDIGGIVGASVWADNINITIFKYSGGYYDQTYYESTATASRGFITVQYEE